MKITRGVTIVLFIIFKSITLIQTSYLSCLNKCNFQINWEECSFKIYNQIKKVEQINDKR